MKNFALLIFLLLTLSCGSTQMVKTTDPPQTNTSPDGPEALKTEIKNVDKKTSIPSFTDAATIGKHMNFLASDELKGRDSGSEGIELAARYIQGYFEEHRVKPYFESYRDTLTNFKQAAYNVVGMVEGSDPVLKDEYIIIGAHYDHIGTVKPENGDYIANGANDNASGTSTVMELAKYFGDKKTNKRSLIFALFSAEEKGLLGSEHLAKKLKEQNLNLYVMLNFEMTGVPLRGKDYLMYITGYRMSNLAEVGNSYVDGKAIGYLPTATEYNLFQRSDNYPFYQEFKVPSHTFCTFDFNNFAYYHKPGDEVDEMDFEHMATLVNTSIPIIEGIVNAPTKEIKMN